MPSQIDPFNAECVLDTTRTTPGSNKRFQSNDRFIFETTRFGRQYDGSSALPCNTDFITEIVAKDRPTGSNFAYVAACKKIPQITPSMSPLVVHNATKLQFQTDQYTYEYQPTNQLLFRTLKASLQNGTETIAGHNSDFKLRLNFKRFFTMNFGNDDVESYVEASHIGDVGAVTLVNFYIKALIFKVDLKMATMASFYQDSAHIPMIVDVPMAAENHLNKGSGLLYTFKPVDATFDLSPGASTVSRFIPEINPPLPEQVAQSGETHCSDTSCFYRLKGKVADRSFSVDIDLPRAAVRRGFYPKLVTDVAAFKQTMGWGSSSRDDKDLIGFYYENSALEKGRFLMSYWIGFHNDGQPSTCPSRVDIRETRRAEDITSKVSH